MLAPLLLDPVQDLYLSATGCLDHWILKWAIFSAPPGGRREQSPHGGRGGRAILDINSCGCGHLPKPCLCCMTLLASTPPPDSARCFLRPSPVLFSTGPNMHSLFLLGPPQPHLYYPPGFIYSIVSLLPWELNNKKGIKCSVLWLAQGHIQVLIALISIAGPTSSFYSLWLVFLHGPLLFD